MKIENCQKWTELNTDSAVFNNGRDESGRSGDDFETFIFLNDEVADQRIFLEFDIFLFLFFFVAVLIFFDVPKSFLN